MDVLAQPLPLGFCVYGLTLNRVYLPVGDGQLKIRVVNMLSETGQEKMADTKANLDMEVESSMERVLANLTTGRLSERIADAARLAVAKHMVLAAQTMRSAVEAEDSAE